MLKTLSGETKMFLGIIAITIIIIVAALFFFTTQENKPPLTRDELIPAGTATYGNASASAYLVEFSDFQCPACLSYEPAMLTIRERFKDTLTIAYRHYPLPQHVFAENASLAAIAAQKQGKFWEMHDVLFKNQSSLSNEVVENGVKELGLNEATFAADLKSSEAKDQLMKDKTDGMRFGVNSTPTFYLNGKKLTNISPQALISIVEQATK